MLYEVLGCGSGSMGEAIAWRLLQEEGSVVFVSDQNPKREKETIEKFKKMPVASRSRIFGSIGGKGLDILKQKKDLPEIFENSNMVINALPASLSPIIAEAVLQANETRLSPFNDKIHYCDLGGVLETAKKIIFSKLARRAEACGASLVPDCGLEPGLGNILAMGMLEHFDLREPLDSLIIYVGGLPYNHTQLPLYKKLFNLKGLEEIYYTRPLVLSGGKPRKIKPLSHYETMPTGDFDLYFGEKDSDAKFEAAVTGGLGTLPYYLKSHVLTLQEKTLRFPGHYDLVKYISQAKFQEIFGKWLDAYPIQEKDISILKVAAKGKSKITGRQIMIEKIMNVESDENWTSMQKSTGFTTAVIAKLIAEGKASAGAYPPEIAIPPKLVLDALKKDFSIYERQTPLS